MQKVFAYFLTCHTRVHRLTNENFAGFDWAKVNFAITPADSQLLLTITIDVIQVHGHHVVLGLNRLIYCYLLVYYVCMKWNLTYSCLLLVSFIICKRWNVTDNFLSLFLFIICKRWNLFIRLHGMYCMRMSHYWNWSLRSSYTCRETWANEKPTWSVAGCREIIRLTELLLSPLFHVRNEILTVQLVYCNLFLLQSFEPDWLIDLLSYIDID